MQTDNQFEFSLEDGRTMLCSMTGHGKRLGYIVGGPGSFYFKGLSSLHNDYTFVTCDTLWTYRKTPVERELSVVTKESIINQENLVIKALKQRFPNRVIDGFGFSAPGALLFELALQYPANFDLLIGTGIGLVKLDPTFTKTNEIFKRDASPRRKEIFEGYQIDYAQIKEGEGTAASLGFFDLKSSQKLSKPYKKFVAETLSMAPKLICDMSNPAQYQQAILNHWKTNLFGEHIDKSMQEHFFNSIYPTLNPLPTIEALLKKEQKMLLMYGDKDYITPLPANFLDLVKPFSSISIHVFERCGHMPYIEMAKEYTETIRNFVSQPVEANGLRVGF
jgi:pimeloyl-ACP methyl ester carboxylesterase